MTLRAWTALGAYPVVTLGSAFAAWSLVQSGMRADAAVGCVFLALAVVIQVVERQLVYETTWNEPKGDVLTDLLHFFVSSLGVHFVFQAVATRALPVSEIEVWPHHWPVAAQVMAALLIGELGAYWVHRAMHAGGWLWRVHRIHHSAQRLYAANASRNHPIDSLLILAAFALPLLLLGIGDDVLAVTAAFAIAHLALQHANVDLRLGALNWLFAGPELHRWHHSKSAAEANANYGHVLSVWDQLFGTRWAPRDVRPPVEVGLFEAEPLPDDFPSHLLAAFVPMTKREGPER